MSPRLGLASQVTLAFIRFYQSFVSPLLGPRCRFYPTCSQYAVIAISEWGFLKGTWLATKRILRCGPWHDGGYDPPPLRPRTGVAEKNDFARNL